MEKKDYSELMDCLKNVNMGLMCLLHVNWTSHPEARGFYYKFEKHYDELRHWLYKVKEDFRTQAETGKDN